MKKETRVTLVDVQLWVVGGGRYLFTWPRIVPLALVHVCSIVTQCHLLAFLSCSPLVCLSVYLSVCLSVCLSICLSGLEQGSKKLDKAEILEMTIEYVQRMQAQGGNRGAGMDQI